MTIKQKIYDLTIKNIIRVSPTIGSRVLYRRRLKKQLNLNNPQDFNEKLQWLKLNWQHPLIVTCTDRVELKHYVRRKGFEEILIKSYGVFNSVDEIDWNKLPKKFVMKVNNGCSNHIMCLDKKQLDKEQILKTLKKSMMQNYSLLSAEMQYEKIIPKIICEEYIISDARDSLIDYKIYCFNGSPKLVLLCLDRHEEAQLHRFFLDLEWNKMNIGGTSMNCGNIPVHAPACFNQMLYYAAQLSQEFPFVRIDFYEKNKMPKLGEMTFTPMACLAGADYYSEQGLKMLGEMLTLPKETFRNFQIKNA